MHVAVARNSSEGCSEASITCCVAALLKDAHARLQDDIDTLNTEPLQVPPFAKAHPLRHV